MKLTKWILLLVMIVPALLGAQESRIWQSARIDTLDFPTASIDNIFIPFANPSLLATGHASGLGWAHMFDSMKFQKHYWAFANFDGLAYNYEYTKDALTGKSVNYHTVAAGIELLPRTVLPNLYVGAHYRWKNDGFGKGDIRSAVTYRPHPSTSVAFLVDNPYKESPAYHAGVALRPLAFVPKLKDHRLELSADLDYSKKSGSYTLNSAVIGLNTQIRDGLRIGASYNLDNQTTQVNFSIALGKTELGGLGSFKANDNYAIPYIHFTDDIFSPFLGLKSKNWYGMKLKGNLVTYKAPKYTVGKVRIYEEGDRTIDSVIEELGKAQTDPNIEGILLKNPSFATSLALQQELVSAIQDFKSTGKQVAVYYDNISNGGYVFAASIADRIYLNPMGSVDLRGLSMTSPYFKELLDTLGVDVLNFRSHKYKNAGNMFSEYEMTEAEREVNESLLQSLFDQMVAAVNAGRGERLRDSVENTIDAGPYYLASLALDAGLVDELIYEEQLDKTLKKDFGFARVKNKIPEYRDQSWTQERESLIAVIYAQGNIVMGKGPAGQSIAHETTANMIRAARKNPAYKGIILRVDSGGGSAQASDIILNELKLAQTENKKPVVVSMSGVAASGGYYIACGADRIVANPATLTGSIGVIGLTFNLPRLFDKVGVNWSTVAKGMNADYGTLYRTWREDEKKRMEGFIEAVYEDFVGKVDAGRSNLSLEEVHSLAQGRVWTGEQARDNGLIDDLGGMDMALEHMRELTNIKGRIKLVNATTKGQGFEVKMSNDPLSSLPSMQMLNLISADYLKIYELWRDFNGEKAVMISPVNPEIIQF